MLILALFNANLVFLKKRLFLVIYSNFGSSKFEKLIKKIVIKLFNTSLKFYRKIV